MKGPLRVLVLGGGLSAEHEVSLNTARMIVEHLRPDRYKVIQATIAKNGTWLIQQFWPMQEKEAIATIKNIADVVFLALHGEYGEDGTIQSLFDQQAIHYTGSRAHASRLGMNKILSREHFRIAGLAVPRGYAFTFNTFERKKNDIISAVASYFVFPIVLKPADQGSSVGVSIAHALPYLETSIHAVFHHSSYALAEEFIDGIELSCGVLETPRGKARPLPPTEIQPKKNSFFDYSSKYIEKGADEITPARIPKSVLQRTQEAALAAHRTIGCRGYSRTDMIWNPKTNGLCVLEINTLPGLTRTSILPQEARVAGISFSQLLDGIISGAMR